MVRASAAHPQRAVRSALSWFLAEHPTADMATLTAVRRGRPTVVAHTDDRAYRLDLLQQRTGSGPCMQAASLGRTIFADVTQVRMLWPQFARSAREEHIGSFLIAPLLHDDVVLGTLNVYCGSSHSFEDGAEATIEPFVPALVATLRALPGSLR